MGFSFGESPTVSILSLKAVVFPVTILLRSLTGDPVAVYRAICHDPLTAAVLSLAEIRRMTNELFAVHEAYLPQFKVHRV